MGKRNNSKHKVIKEAMLADIKKNIGDNLLIYLKHNITTDIFAKDLGQFFEEFKNAVNEE